MIDAHEQGPLMTQTDTQPGSADAARRDQMNIVVIGHVDHGKSTVIGRLLADTGSLPEGKLERVKEQCRRTSKPFEYAFLLDALKDEQAQGITIDSARCFFQSARREYIIIDAPGHIEFLKNMISGAARAEAGLLIIDAKEGVQENSRRHGYLVGMLGIRQLTICINKMDLVEYSQEVFESIRDEYRAFLAQVGIEPRGFVPISARLGDCVIGPSENMPWYTGPSVLHSLDAFEKQPPPTDQDLRLPVQDVYKFTAEGDDRRIVAGRIETGTLGVGDEVVFLPSGKRSRIATVEAFNRPPHATAEAGQSTGVTLDTQIYVKPGELICKAGQTLAKTTSRLHVNLIWLSPNPMIMGKQYKIKLAAARAAVWLTDVDVILDASELTTTTKRRQIERHDVASCTLETLKPLACDPAAAIPQTGRFVIIDNYEIAGGGIVLEAEEKTNTLIEAHVRQRETAWDRTSITTGLRAGRYSQRAAMVLICGPDGGGIRELAKAVEEYLFHCGRMVYYLGVSSTMLGIDSDLKTLGPQRSEYLRRLGEIAHMFTDAGVIFITTVADLDDYELDVIDTLNQPNELVVINVGENRFSRRRPDMVLDRIDVRSLQRIHELLQSKKYILEYHL